MLLGGNKYYHLNLKGESFRIMAGFGGGLSTEELCGTISGGVAVIGILFTEKEDYDSGEIKEASKDFVQSFQKKLTSTNCKEIKESFREEERKCTPVVEKGAEILEEIIKKYQTNQDSSYKKEQSSE